MSYQVIARKYRPQRFSDVVGQEHVTRTLSNAIQKDRIHHAYLFVGPRGTGKTTIARIFAKCLNCTGGPSVDFTDEDERCREIAEGRSLDVIEIDGASNRGIEEIRELRETVKYAPTNAPYKIYIIDEVHMLTKEAFNALLKTLEEPPAHVKFMFATTEPEKVLPTILSRCQRFDLRRISTPLIVRHLSSIAEREQVSVAEPALHAIARGADGGMRDAASTLDQLISFCGTEIHEEDVLSMFGLTSQSQMLDLTACILEGREAELMKRLNDLAQGGKDLGRLLGELILHLRNLVMFRLTQGSESWLEVTEAEARSLKEQAGLVPLENLHAVLDVLVHAEGRFRTVSSKRIFLEVTLWNALVAARSPSVDAVLRELVQWKGSPSSPAPTESASPRTPAPSRETPTPTGGGSFASLKASLGTSTRSAAPAETRPPAAPVPPPAQVAEVSPTPQTAPTSAPAAMPSQASAPPKRSLEEIWEQALQAVKQASPLISGSFQAAFPVSFTNDTLVLAMDSADQHQMALADTPKNRAAMVSRLQELGYAQATVRFEVRPNPRGPVSHQKVEAPQTPAPRQPTAPAASTLEQTASAAPAPVEKPAPPPPAEEGSLDMETFRNDPLIQSALEIFKGQIAGIKK